MNLFFAVSVTLAFFITQVVVGTILLTVLQMMSIPNNVGEIVNNVFQFGTMLCSVAWMVVDSKKIGLCRYQGFICERPVRLAIAGALLWIVVFPMYLCKRWDINHGVAKLKPELANSVS
ncbi:MAG: hypothetical protein K2W95_32695 [Candidatus Obscuribacterales bacterium]|nr:hypothetical protein [Candidatus Obscuribacterales bacterium]